MPWKEQSVMELRKLFVLKSLEPGANITQLCQEFDISRKTGYKWIKRYKESGFKGLADMSKRPKSCPHKIDLEICLEIIRLKNDHPDWGPKKIHVLLERRHDKQDLPARVTVERILDRAGLVKHIKKRKRHPPVKKKEIIQPLDPNDVWTVDFKGWWLTSLGIRCEPLTIRDEFSKFILLLKSMENTTSEAVKSEFKILFKKYGLPKVIRFDNGQPFACTKAVCRLTRLSVWFISLGIRIDPTNLGSPQDNGGHERMHKDIRDQLEQRGITDQESFDIWTHEFNWVRPHETLGMKTPSDVYRKSDRVLPEIEIQIDYPPPFLSRIVTPRGLIRYQYKYYFISSSLVGMKVGLKPKANNRLEVWFDYLFLGEIDAAQKIFFRHYELEGVNK